MFTIVFVIFYNNTYLAMPIPRNKDILCCQVSVNKTLARKVGHSRGHLATEAEENVLDIFIMWHVEQVASQVSSSA